MSGNKKIIKRIIDGAGANLIAQVVNTALQLSSLPIFLTYWSLGEYGVWLMMSAIPAYIALCDFGVVTVTSNLMGMSASQGKLYDAVRIYRFGFMATTAAILSLVLALILFLIFAVAFNLLEQKNIVTIILLCATAFIGIYTGLVEAVFRANNKFAVGVNIATGARVFEWLSLVTMYFMTQSFFGTAAGAFFGRLTAAFFVYIYMRRKYPDYAIRNLEWNYNEVAKLFSKGMSFMAFPIGNSIQIQGLILIAGALFGAPYAAVFGIYRTISRSIVQVTAIFSRAMWPEITSAYANGDVKLIKQLVSRGTIITLLSAIFISTLIILNGELIVYKWTNGVVAYEEGFMIKIIITTLMSSVWQVPYVALMATNNTKHISKIYLTASFFSLIVAYSCATIFDGGKNSLLISIGFFEFAMLIGCTIFVKHIYRARHAILSV